jgi:hypothetical protein
MQSPLQHMISDRRIPMGFRREICTPAMPLLAYLPRSLRERQIHVVDFHPVGILT